MATILQSLNCSMTTVSNKEMTDIQFVLILISWFLIEFIGNALLIGLIQFERMEGDPLKRRMTDQLLTSVYIMLVVLNLTSGNLIAWVSMTNINFGLDVSYILIIFTRFNIIFTLMVMFESMLLRIMIEFIWKRVPLINQDFVAKYLTWINLLVGLQLTVIGSFAKRNQEPTIWTLSTELLDEEFYNYRPR